MKRYIDITQKLNVDTRGVEILPQQVLEIDGWNSSFCKLSSLAGTHVSAPASFGMLNEDVSAYPVSRFISKARVVYVEEVIPGDILTCDILGDVEDAFVSGESLIIRTGWSEHVNHQEMYRDKLPTLGRDLAEWCVRKKVNVLGVEPPSVADLQDVEELQYIHRLLFRGGVIVVEGLTNLHSITKDFVDLYVFPLKIENSHDCPVRVVVMEEV